MKKAAYITLALLALVLVVCGAGVMLRYHLLAWYLGIEQPTHWREIAERDIMVPMRDGVRLATDVYRPGGEGPFPTMLVRLPYGKKFAEGVTFAGIELSPKKLFTQRGYNVVVQNTRGRFNSEGEFYPFLNEYEDGRDTIEWIEQQPWHNGLLGATGASYLGQTAWSAAIATGDAVDCLSVAIVSSDLHVLLHRGGAFNLSTFVFWATIVGESEMDWEAPRRMRADNQASLYELPLIEIDDRLGRDIPFFNDWLSHPVRGEYSAQFDARDRMDSVTAPTLMLTGWYDVASGETLRDYERMAKRAGSDPTRLRIIVGPWSHMMHGITEGDAHPMVHLYEMFDWHAYHLKGEGTLSDKPVKIYVMGRNEWREEDEWPPRRAVPTPYYLFSGGSANSSDGDGELRTAPDPGGAETDHYTYDPADPVLTRGGHYIGPGAGPADQRDIESRSDVLVYTSPPLEEPLEVTGYITMHLFAATNREDTDFTAKLCDVHPDGTSINVASGIIRARYRDEGKDSPLVPGQVYPFEIDLWATSNVFLPGHRVRVLVSSSDFPRYDRNLNLYSEQPAHQTEFVAAEQTIFHSDQYPSRIILPVVPE